MNNEKIFDVVIIGGSYSGLSAAMALGRSQRNVLIIDKADPCNKQTPYSHNFLTQDGETPLSIALKAKEQVLNYPSIEFLNDQAIAIDKKEIFEIQCAGRIVKAEYLILATGVEDIMPTIKGFSESWGISIIHCPYCHGYEVRNQKTGILGNGDLAYHYVKLLTNLTDELVIFTNGKADFTEDQQRKIKQYNVEIVENQVSELIHANGYLSHVQFVDHTTYPIQVIYSSFGIKQKSDFAEKLGCEITEKGLIKIDFLQKTSVDKVFACGDNCSPLRSVANAVSAGNMTGMQLNNSLLEARF